MRSSIRPNVTAWVTALVVLAAAAPASAALMCHAAGGSSDRLAAVTARASATFLEAASQAMLAYRALETASTSFVEHRERTTALLDAAIAAYREALALTDDLARADEFLRARPFERLRVTFGISPGSLSAVRWEIIARTARTARTPAADLLGVCVAGAETLKATLGEVKPETATAQIRRSAVTWTQVLTHGGLVSDAFDPSVR